MSTNISLHKFYFDAISRARNTGERYGQAMFNHLSEVKPYMAEAIRSTNADPFYVERLNHPNWDRFVAWLEINWPINSEYAREVLSDCNARPML